MSESYALISLPKLKAAGAYNVAETESYAIISLPILNITVNSLLTFSSSDITLPLLSVEAEFDFTESYADIILPLLQADAEFLYSESYANIDLPILQITAECFQSKSYANIILPKLTVITSGVSHSRSYTNIILPLLQASITAASQTFSSANITLPKLIVEIISADGIVYRYLVLHNEAALTEWDFAHTIDSIVEFDGDIYLASASGLFKLGGDGDHEDSIAATIQTGLSDGGIPNFKQAMGHYISYRSDGNLQLQFIADDETDTTIHELRTSAGKIKTRGGMTEKGSRGRWIGAKITNSFLNSDFRILSLDILTKVLHRKHTDKL